MKKITLILITLITVACTDPKDKYTALECVDPGLVPYMLVMDKDSKTFETYIIKNPGDGPIKAEGPADIVVSGTYIEEGDHHYLYTWDLETFEKNKDIYDIYDDSTVEFFSIMEEPLPLPQFKIDRRDLSGSVKDVSLDPFGFDSPWVNVSDEECRIIDVPKDYLASKKDKDVNLF
tara:strand:- start:482 stop:1009 length:528 start_codon:yes stop_codon:yes gene_type:complete